MEVRKALIFTNTNKELFPRSEDKIKALNNYIFQLHEWGIKSTVILGSDGDHLLKNCVNMQYADIGFSHKWGMFNVLADSPESLGGPCFLCDLETPAQKNYFEEIALQFASHKAQIQSHMLRIVKEDQILRPFIISQNGVYWIKQNFELKEDWQAHDFSWKSFYLRPSFHFTLGL